jgi:acyl-CoA synthetase (AMP-forming)/AMP-acid ligase II
LPEPDPKPNCDLLHEWLRRSAAITPDAVAIVEEERVTSFAQLFAQAQSLALRFRAYGIQPRDRIALVLPKSSDAIVAVFASLLAGAIYVPIHPRWPQERIDAVLAECGARLLIEAQALRRVLPICAPAPALPGRRRRRRKPIPRSCRK